MNESSTVRVPTWMTWMFGVLQPVIAAAMVACASLLWGLSQNVAVLNVRMESIADIRGQLAAIKKTVDIDSNRLTRIETQINIGRHPPDDSVNDASPADRNSDTVSIP